MNKSKFMKMSVSLAGVVLMLAESTMPVIARTNKISPVVHSTVCPVTGVTNLHTHYSGKTHKITFKGDVSGVTKIAFKYNNRVIKSVKVHKNFNTTLAFHGYKTFKICDASNNNVLSKISATKYATKKPNVYSLREENNRLQVQVYGKKGDIIKIWKNRKPILSKKVISSGITTVSVANSKFSNKAKISLTVHTLGKKTSKPYTLYKLDKNQQNIYN
ncbi:hypothetical protein PT281_06110 [Lactobacillus sp. ESL0701]|uniref:hypothetical protein n=1 Tax=Lactobacillus sp. ESL0701 TaxID=2983217 RepID=UPI0023F9EF2D|nr:hypothetical protein [Lactobacillus sp. ESL0701]MDF7672843.1 hypothetical protein [Lactobacillus sp. ESL0701]